MGQRTGRGVSTIHPSCVSTIFESFLSFKYLFLLTQMGVFFFQLHNTYIPSDTFLLENIYSNSGPIMQMRSD